MNRITGLVAVIILLIPELLFSQEFSVSPYSMFGIGDIQMSDGGRLAGMAGTGISIRGSRFVNTNNPASLTSIDSVTFLFDLGVSGKGSLFTSGEVQQKSFNANFTKVAAGMRLTPRWGLGVFVQPYSTVCYKITQKSFLEGSMISNLKEYEGDGGLSRFTVSNGFALTKNLAAGFNTTFLFGGIEKSVSLEDYTIKETAKSKAIFFDFGLQYHKEIGDYEFSLGVVGGYPTVLSFTNRRQIFNNNGYELKDDKQPDTQFTIPEYYGGGISLTKGLGFTVAADYRFQNWSRSKDMQTGRSFRDTHKVSAGVAYIPNELYASNYFGVMQYQLGVSISNSYLNIKNYNPINYEITAGTGLPFRGGTLMNIALAYGKKGTSENGLIREDFFRVILNFSISEKWFAKRLYE